MNTPILSPADLTFQAGGALRENTLYVERDADEALFQALSAGRSCHVLAPRQVGKSSLCARVAKRLSVAGTTCAHVDLTVLGSSSTSPDAWMYSLAHELLRRLDLVDVLDEVWDRQKNITPGQRFAAICKEILRTLPNVQVVVFIDEVDAVLELSFPAADFFWTVRALHNERARNPQLERLTFCFAGVAAPGDLVEEAGRSPFLVSRPVMLRDFSRAQLQPLEKHLSASNASELMDQIWEWTAGHPYMTQRLCEELVYQKAPEDGSPKTLVQAAVDRVFFGRAGRNDPVLFFADQYLRKEQRHLPLSRMLHVYRRMIESGSVRYDPGDASHLRLQLAGFASLVERGGTTDLVIRNKVFRTVFDKQWVEERENELFLGEPLLRWLRAEGAHKQDHLLRGAALRRALEWQKDVASLPPQETAFVEASLQAELADRERALEAQQERERRELAERKHRDAESRTRSTRRILLLAAVSAVLLAAALVALWRQYQDTKAEGESLRLLDVTSTLQRAASAQENEPPAADKLLADAIRFVSDHPERGPSSDRVLHALSALIHQTPRGRVLRGVESAVHAVAISPQGDHILLGEDNGTAEMWLLPDTAIAGGIGSNAAHFVVKHESHEPIRNIEFSRDGAFFVTGSDDGEAHAWSTNDGSHLGRLVSQLGGLRSLHVLANRRVLSTGLDPEAVLVQDLSGNTLDLEQMLSDVEASAVSADGTQFATGSTDGEVALWSQDGTLLVRFWASDAITDVAFSAAADSLAAGTKGGELLLWSLPKGTPKCDLPAHSDSVSSVSFSRDSKQVLTGSYDETAKVWDVDTCTPKVVVGPHYGAVYRAVFLADDVRLATVAGDRSIRIWDKRNGLLLHRLGGHQKLIVGLTLAPSGSWLAAASWDGTASLWEVPHGRPTRTFDAEGDNSAAHVLAYLADGKYVVSGYVSGAVRVWPAQDNVVPTLDASSFIEASNPPRSHADAVRGLVASPDGHRFATAGADGLARLWIEDASTTPPRFRGLPLYPRSQEPGVKRVTHHGEGGSRAITFSARGDLLATGGADGLVHVWDAQTGSHKWELAAHEAEVTSVAFSRDGTSLASGDDEGTLWIWDLSTQHQKVRLKGHTKFIGALTFNEQGQLLSASEDRTARLWDPSTGTEIARFDHDNLVTDAAFSPGGERIATSSWDLTAKLWDAESGALLRTFGEHEGPVRAARWADAGRALWTASLDGRVRRWSTDSGILTADLPSGYDDTWAVVLSPNGRDVAVSDGRGKIRIYPATIPGLLEQACSLLRGSPVANTVEDVCSSYKQGTKR